METDLAKAIIRDVDRSEVLSGECINSPVFGQIPPERLSGGTKTLLLVFNEPEGNTENIGKDIHITCTAKELKGMSSSIQFKTASTI
ncbi:MAG: DUF4869 domain-containing protein [bacterium]